MALKKNIPDPTGVTEITDAYLRIAEANFNFADLVGKVTLNCYRDQASREANKPPVSQISFSLGAEKTDSEGNVTFPSFANLVASHQAEYDALKTALYNLLKMQAELAPCEDC